MLIVTNEPVGFFLVASLAGVVFCAVVLAVVLIWGRGDE